jgi:putative endonuclease
MGYGAAYTRLRRRRPVRLLSSCHFDRIDEAFAFEKQSRDGVARSDSP